MPNGEDDRLARTIADMIEFCKRHRAPKGGAALKRQAERLLSEALETRSAERVSSKDSHDKLLASLAYLAEYLDLLR